MYRDRLHFTAILPGLHHVGLDINVLVEQFSCHLTTLVVWFEKKLGWHMDRVIGLQLATLHIKGNGWVGPY